MGFVDRPWAKRLLLRAFATDYDKEIQHNASMTVPYGEARQGGFSSGASLRYYDFFAGRVNVSAVLGYVFDRFEFVDDTECIYNWFGECRNPQRVPGEILERPTDLSLWDHSGFLRASIGWLIHPDHQLRFTTAPTYFRRTGDDELRATNDPARDERRMLKWVHGVEYEVDLLGGALENVAFAKSYLQVVRANDSVSGILLERDAERALLGAGNALRYDILDGFFAKASYEYAVRLPEAVELFGSGALIADNLELEPERSHNANLTLAVERLSTPGGMLSGSVTGFLREAEQMTVLLRFGDITRFQNVTDARVWGIEGTLGWISPGEYLELGGNATFQSQRNTSSEGRFGAYEGDRIPNRPYFWANGQARVQLRGVVASTDELSFTWYTRYVHEFFRNWESVGRRDTKELIPPQLVHAVVLAYVVVRGEQELSFSAEVRNLTDERAYDVFGVQLPGRASYFKATLAY